MENNLQKLKEIIYEAHPEKFERKCDCHGDLCELCVLGRTVTDESLEITLADVLVALKEKMSQISILNAVGEHVLLGHSELTLNSFANWNLKETLDNQTPKTINSLYNILK